MATSSVEGEWNGIVYRLFEHRPSERCVSFDVVVHEDLLDWPGEELTTEAMSFFGYEWTASLTAKEDERIEVSWRLLSPVDETASLQCCWLMFAEHSVPGPSCPLEQNGRYGGMTPKILPNAHGFIKIQIALQLHASNECLSVYQNRTDIYCVLPVMTQEDGHSIRSDRFLWQGREWGLGLFLHGPLSNLRCMVKLAATDPTFSRCVIQAVMIDPSSPDLSRMQSTRVSYEGAVRLRFTPSQQSITNGDRPTARESWLKLGLRLALPETPSRLVNDYCPFSTSRMAIEVLADKHIKRHVAKEASIDLFGIPKNTAYYCLPHQLLKDVERMMHKDAQLDASQSTIWLLCRERNGVFSKAVCLDALEPFDFRLCELRMHGHPDAPPSIAFYFRQSGKEEVSGRPKNPILLFCMFLNPRERKLEFLGSILVDGNSKLYSICFGDICGLHKGLMDTECSFFRIHSADRITQICAFQKTVKATGLPSGSTIVVRPMLDGEEVNAGSVRQELQNLRPEGHGSLDPSDTHSTDDDFAYPDPSCVICQNNPQTSGFYHGETVHVCACEECARKVYEQEPCRCPICMQPCTGWITKIFEDC